MKETGSVLDVKDGWVQETIELLVEVRVLPEGETREDLSGELVKGTEAQVTKTSSSLILHFCFNLPKVSNASTEKLASRPVQCCLTLTSYAYGLG